MFQQIRNALRLKGREEGATAVEYGIMVAAIAAVIIGIVITLGNNVANEFDCTADSLGTGANECDTQTVVD